MNSIRLILLSALFASLTVWFSCSLNQVAGGTDTETGGNKIVGVIKTSDGSAAAHTTVTLIPSGYNPIINDPLPESLTVTTDTNGVYSIQVQTNGTYNIQAVDLVSRSRLLLYGITYTGSKVTVQPTVLSRPGSLRITLPGSISRVNGFIFIPGTTIKLPLTKSNAAIVLDSVPSGTIPSVMYFDSVFSRQQIIRSNVKIISEMQTVIVNPLWAFEQKIYLNTTSSGANVMGNVPGFPVLLRLTANNFTFAQAQHNGSDLRFTQHDSVPIPYEIERWDSVNQQAEVWVKPDTVYGNNSSQYITMYWGTSTGSVATSTSSAAQESNSSSVFDTSAGFQGIWHLGETDSLFTDATANHYNGTGYFTKPVTGIIGTAQHFNGVSSFIQMKGTAPQSRLNFPMNGHYTISAWVYHDTLADSVTYLVAGKGELQYFLKTFGLANSTSQHEHQWEFTEYHADNNWQASTFIPATQKTWDYLVGIRDGANQYLYVNGSLVMEGYQKVGTGTPVSPRDTSEDFSIGAFLKPTSDWSQGRAFFSGSIDEVDVSSVPRSADWIKLSYMNQRTDDKLITFGK